MLKKVYNACNTNSRFIFVLNPRDPYGKAFTDAVFTKFELETQQAAVQNGCWPRRQCGGILTFSLFFLMERLRSECGWGTQSCLKTQMEWIVWKVKNPWSAFFEISHMLNLWAEHPVLTMMKFLHISVDWNSWPLIDLLCLLMDCGI